MNNDPSLYLWASTGHRPYILITFELAIASCTPLVAKIPFCAFCAFCG